VTGSINGTILYNMKSYPILILAYRRTTELELVLESLAQLNPSVVYFHLHRAPDEEAQKDVEAVKKLILSYKGKKEVMYSKEPLGVRNSMRTALEWISSKEEIFFVFEDDIVLKEGSAENLMSEMQLLEKSGGVLKFGEHRKHGVYWGWAVDSRTAKSLLEKSILDVPEGDARPHFNSKMHYLGVMELFRRAIKDIAFPYAWDDEFSLLTKVLYLNEILSKEQLTDHIGYESTRVSNNIDMPFGQGTHVMFKNGVLIPQENEKA